MPAGRIPLGGLAGDRGDEIDVMVVVQHDEPDRLSSRGDHQIRDLCTALLRSIRTNGQADRLWRIVRWADGLIDE